MFKMPSSGENHGNPKFVAGINHFLVADAATRLHNEFYAVFVGSFNAVAKREKASEISTDSSSLASFFRLNRGMVR